MARVNLVVQRISPTGTSVTYTAGDATNGHSFRNDGSVVLHVKNGGTAAVTVTIPTPAKVAGMDVADASFSVAAGGDVFAGPFSPSVFNQADGTVWVDLSAASGVTLAAIGV